MLLLVLALLAPMRSRAGVCRDLSQRLASIDKECCDEPTESCTNGKPKYCNSDCASIFLDVFSDCKEELHRVLGSKLSNYDPVVKMCHLTEMSPCKNVPCLNGGKCHAAADGNGHRRLEEALLHLEKPCNTNAPPSRRQLQGTAATVCVCPPGFKGSKCEQQCSQPGCAPPPPPTPTPGPSPGGCGPICRAHVSRLGGLKVSTCKDGNTDCVWGVNYGNLSGTYFTATLTGKNGVPTSDYIFAITSLANHGGAYSDRMVEQCSKIGMKPVCDHPSYCKNDKTAVYLGQTQHIAYMPHRLNNSLMPGGFAAIQNKWDGLCSYTNKANGNYALCNIPTNTHAWRYPRQYNPGFVCGRVTMSLGDRYHALTTGNADPIDFRGCAQGACPCCNDIGCTPSRNGTSLYNTSFKRCNRWESVAIGDTPCHTAGVPQTRVCRPTRTGVGTSHPGTRPGSRAGTAENMCVDIPELQGCVWPPPLHTVDCSVKGNCFTLSGAKNIRGSGRAGQELARTYGGGWGVPIGTDLNGEYVATAYTCHGKPVWQKGGSGGPVLYLGSYGYYLAWIVGHSSYPAVNHTKPHPKEPRAPVRFTAEIREWQKKQAAIRHQPLSIDCDKRNPYTYIYMKASASHRYKNMLNGAGCPASPADCDCTASDDCGEAGQELGGMSGGLRIVASGGH